MRTLVNRIKGKWQYVFIGLLIRTFQVNVTSVVSFLVAYSLVAYLVSDISHPPSCFIIWYIFKTCCELVKSQ